MVAIGKILVLLGFIRLLNDDSYSVRFCAGFYAFVVFILNVIFDNLFEVALTGAFVSFFTSLLYFFLLRKTQYTPILWWPILILGFLIGLV